jgi:hypothetical protein
VKILPRVEHCRAQITNILYLPIFIYIFEVNMSFYYILSSNKGICVWPIWPEVSCPYFHTPGKWPVIGLLQDHFHIEAHIGPGQYGCLFSRCRKYVINSLIHGHFHIGLVIIPRPILARNGISGQYGGLGMITRPIWKCPWINLHI